MCNINTLKYQTDKVDNDWSIRSVSDNRNSLKYTDNIIGFFRLYCSVGLGFSYEDYGIVIVC